jgi:hypothetical protein
MIDTVETLHAVETHRSVVRRKSCLSLDDWSLRRRRLRVRRVGFGTKRTKTANKDDAGNEGDEQSNGYLEHLSHPMMFGHSGGVGAECLGAERTKDLQITNDVAWAREDAVDRKIFRLHDERAVLVRRPRC